MRCDLVALENVRRAIERIIETNDDRYGSERAKAHDGLKVAMRADPKITK